MEQKEILAQFSLRGTPLSCKRYGCGHINVTYLVTTDTKRRYILQKINHHVFQDVAGLMENITAVTRFLAQRSADPRKTMTIVPTKTGESYYFDGADGYFRVYDFVEGSICLQSAEIAEDLYQSAVGFGRFAQELADFPAETLRETIPDFHNTTDRYRLFRAALDQDSMRRSALVQEEIRFALEREVEGGSLVRLQKSGKLPLRVTHNDTKLNNVLLDETTRTALCVIDLDTVMPGLSLYDYGDSIRFGAATAAEDTRDLSKMTIDLDRFASFTKGYLLACPSLTNLEVQLLPLGAKIMTLECGVRFLTDYLQGDHYFATQRPGQNLDRARTQFKLVSDMEKRWDDMNKIVMDLAKQH